MPDPASPRLTGASPAVSILDVGEHNDGQRLDNFLLGRLKGVPKSMIYRVIRKGEVRVNGGRAKPDTRLQQADKVRIPPIRMASAQAPVKPGTGLATALLNAVLYEDEDLLVLNKPSGIAVHAGSGTRQGLIETLRALYPQYPGLELVHRLDKGTSGCLLVAKTGKARKAAMEAFRKHAVQKVYHVIVEGTWPAGLTRISRALSRLPERNGERKVQTDREGKEADTEFVVLRNLTAATLLEARPLTGRTHQIRVHAASAGHPVLGDEKYADGTRTRTARRLCLHAAELVLAHPVTGSELRCQAPYDAAFMAELQSLQAG